MPAGLVQLALASLLASPGSGPAPYTIEEQPARLQPTDAIFLCGRRATAETLLASEGIARTALSPVDALNELGVRFDPAPTLVSVRVSPVSVEKSWSFPDGSRMETVWRVDAEKPVVQAVFTFRGPSAGTLDCRATVRVLPNLSYVNKFVQHDDAEGEVVGRSLAFHKRGAPDLRLRVWSDSPAATAGVGAVDGAPGRLAGVLEIPLCIGSGQSRIVKLWAAASDMSAELDALGPKPHVRSPDGALKGAFVFTCPDKGLNEFVRACCTTMALNVRDLPFGEPFSMDGALNKRRPVVTASPDYHGIFANDCIQTLWEGGLLGPAFREAARNSVDTMFRFGPYESVEWWTGNGKVWRFQAPLGDTPQIVMGACRHLLWTGDQGLAERWWPDIVRCLAVLPANDKDGDWLEDRPNTPYPEQPNPGEYNHEMLYVQCFWHQAYLKASQVAEWLGKAESVELGETADRIAKSIESRFATPYGLGVWLNARHEPHPHIGHEQIIAAAQGDVSDERARLIVRTAMSPPIWTDDGPLRAEPGKGVAAGDHVWNFMRWKLVLALFRLGQTDEALGLARRWSAQERALRYQAPEGFPTITGTTGKAYTWSAGRALRALAFGLSGLDMNGQGVRFAPRLPTDWDTFEMRDLSIHGARVSLRVRRGPPRVLIDGRSAADAFVPYDRLERGVVRVEAWVR